MKKNRDDSVSEALRRRRRTVDVVDDLSPSSIEFDSDDDDVKLLLIAMEP